MMEKVGSMILKMLKNKKKDRDNQEQAMACQVSRTHSWLMRGISIIFA